MQAKEGGDHIREPVKVVSLVENDQQCLGRAANEKEVEDPDLRPKLVLYYTSEVAANHRPERPWNLCFERHIDSRSLRNTLIHRTVVHVDNVRTEKWAIITDDQIEDEADLEELSVREHF